MTADDALAMPVPGFAVDVGCGSLTDIYENTTGHTQCKSIQVHNDCQSISFLHFSYSSTLAVWKPGQTKTYDVNVLPLEVVVLDCGGSNLDKTGCCSYAVDTCNPVPDEPVPDEPSPDEPSPDEPSPDEPSEG
jgi:hypothetical protein